MNFWILIYIFDIILENPINLVFRVKVNLEKS